MKGGIGLGRKISTFGRFLIFLLSGASIRKKLLKTTNAEESVVHTNSESCNIQLGS